MTQRADFATAYRTRNRIIETERQRPAAAKRQPSLLLTALALMLIGAGGGALLLGGTGGPGIDTTVTGAIDPAVAGLAQFDGL